MVQVFFTDYSTLFVLLYVHKLVFTVHYYVNRVQVFFNDYHATCLLCHMYSVQELFNDYHATCLLRHMY